MNSSYALNFVIPQGPTGPQGIIGPTGATGITGPTGPANGLNAYGGRYNNNASSISLGLLSQTQIPLTTTMPNLNTTYTTDNSITITNSGVYEINYFLNVSVTVGTTLTMAVRNNGTNIPSTVISRLLSVGTSSVYSGSTIVNLPAGSVIDMAISALVAVGVNLSNGVNATLTVKRLN